MLRFAQHDKNGSHAERSSFFADVTVAVTITGADGDRLTRRQVFDEPAQVVAAGVVLQGA